LLFNRTRYSPYRIFTIEPSGLRNWSVHRPGSPVVEGCLVKTVPSGAVAVHDPGGFRSSPEMDVLFEFPHLRRKLPATSVERALRMCGTLKSPTSSRATSSSTSRSSMVLAKSPIAYNLGKGGRTMQLTDHIIVPSEPEPVGKF